MGIACGVWGVWAEATRRSGPRGTPDEAVDQAVRPTFGLLAAFDQLAVPQYGDPAAECVHGRQVMGDEQDG
jgi:hypothetical protein